jgi:hypothetical protein
MNERRTPRRAARSLHPDGTVPVGTRQLDPGPVAVDVILDFVLDGITGRSAGSGAHGTADDGARRASDGSAEDRATDGATGSAGACADLVVVAFGSFTGDRTARATDGGTGQRTWRSPEGATNDGATNGASGTTSDLTADVGTVVPVEVTLIPCLVVRSIPSHVFLPTCRVGLSLPRAGTDGRDNGHGQARGVTFPCCSGKQRRAMARDSLTLQSRDGVGPVRPVSALAEVLARARALEEAAITLRAAVLPVLDDHLAA